MSAVQQAEKVRLLQTQAEAALRAGIPVAVVEEGLSAQGYSLATLNTAVARLNQLGGAQPADVGFGGRALGSALFNFGDEALAGIRASGMRDVPGLPGAVAGLADQVFYGGQRGVPGNYQGELAAARMGLDEYARQNPRSALAADVTGALLPAVASGGAALAGRTGAQALAQASAQTAARAAPTALGVGGRAALIGAAEGALSGAGQGEDLRGRLIGAGTGAAGGAIIGGTLGAGTQALSNWMSRRNIPAQAQRYYLNLLNEEGRSVDDVMAEIMQRESIGVGDNIVADVMGPAFRSEMSGVAQQDATLRRELTDFLNDRGRGQADQLRGALSQATGGRVTNTAREAANRMVRARDLTKPMYESFRRSAPFVDDPGLGEAVATRPGLQAALTTAQRNLLDETGRPDISHFDVGQEVTGLTLDDATRQLTPQMRDVYRSTLTPTALQQVIQETGGAVNDISNPTLTSAQKNAARATLGARNALLSRLQELADAGDARAKAYIDANRIFASEAEYGDMARAGRQFLDADSETAETLLRMRPEASATGQQAFGEGALDALSQRLAGAQNVAGRVNSAVNRAADDRSIQRLTEAFPEMRGAPYQNFVQQLDALAQQTSTRNQFLGGMTRRSTGSRVGEDAALQATSGELSSGFFQGNALPFIAGAATRGMRQGAADALQAERRAAAPLFSAVGSRNIAPLLQDVARTRAIDTSHDAFTRNAPGLAGGGAAGAALQNTGAAEQFGISRDTSVGPRREDVLRGIEQRERFINDPNTPPEERAQLEQQRDRLRLLL